MARFTVPRALSRAACVGVMTIMLPASRSALAGPFVPGNILATQSNHLREYTLSGVLVRDLEVPHPDTSRRDATDVVVDRWGRAHVLNIAPFANDYLSTYDPLLGTWSHHAVLASLGNISDGDLAILGDTAFTKHQAISLLDFSTVNISIPGYGVGEISVGLDGQLYALDSGSPRHGVRILDPGTYAVIDTLELRDAGGSRLDARGIAVTAAGDIFAADWDGRIYAYDRTATLLESPSTGAGNLLDLDLAADGTMIVGSRFGTVVVTDTSLDSVFRFSAGSGETYVGFVFIPEPGTALLLAAGAVLAGLRSTVPNRVSPRWRRR